MPDGHDDRRDDELTRALAVASLDELTRRRLVARALEEARDVPASDVRGARRGRFAAVAAVAAFVLLGVAALALPGGDTTEVAGRSAPQQEAATGGAAAPSPAAPSPAAPSPAAPSPTAVPLDNRGATGTSADAGSAAEVPDANASARSAFGLSLGDFGNLATGAARRRLLTAIDGASLPPPAKVEGSVTGVVPCPVTGLSGLVANATGDVDGRPAIVVVTRRDDASLRVRIVATDPCEVRELR